MKSPHVAWNREKDVQLVRCMLSGLIGDGIAETMGITRSQVANRIQRLGISLKDARAAKRQGLSPEQYLDTSPLYKINGSLPLLAQPSELEKIKHHLDTVLTLVNALLAR